MTTNRKKIHSGIRLLTMVLLAMTLLLSCKGRTEDGADEGDEYDSLDFDEMYQGADHDIAPDTTSAFVASWLKSVGIDSAERVLCHNNGCVNTADTSFYIFFGDVLRCFPQAMDYPFVELALEWGMNIVRSDDGRLRFFYWNTGMGGTCPDIARYTLLKDQNGKVHLIGDSEDSPQLIDIYTLKTKKGDTIYLLHEYFREWSTFGAAWAWACRIKGSTLDTLTIFPHNERSVGLEYYIPDWYFITNNGEGWGWLFEMHGNDLYVPDNVDGELIDRYLLYRWNGNRFDSIGNVGNRNLHPSLSEYNRLAVYFVTEGFRVRVDMMDDSTYRYASWPRKKETSDKPDIVIYGGRYDKDQYCYVFENNGYTYRAGDISYSCHEDEKLSNHLIVEKGGKVILKQEKEHEYD